MKVLHLGKYYDPIVGGIESVTKLVVDSLPEDIHHIICFNNFSKTVIEENGKIRVFRTACYGKLAKQPLSFQYFSVLKKELKDFMPDVVHFHYPNPLVALYILFCIPSKIKLIVHWHSDIVEQKILWRIISPIEQKILLLT